MRALIEAGVLVYLILLALSSIIELNERQELLLAISSKVEKLRTQVDQLSKSESSVPAKGAEIASQLGQLIIELDYLNELKGSASILISVGGNSTKTLRSLLTKSAIVSLATNRVETTSNLVRSSNPHPFVGTFTANFLYSPFEFISDTSSESVLALLILVCGPIGAAIAGVRSGSVLTLRQLALGFCTGFISYLAIRGGKHVFLLQAEGAMVQFNAYSCAFMAVLASLFTNRSYSFLSDAVDELVQRLRVAIGLPRSNEKIESTETPADPFKKSSQAKSAREAVRVEPKHTEDAVIPGAKEPPGSAGNGGPPEEGI
jgi:hypothetical protein